MARTVYNVRFIEGVFLGKLFLTTLLFLPMLLEARPIYLCHRDDRIRYGCVNQERTIYDITLTRSLETKNESTGRLEPADYYILEIPGKSSVQIPASAVAIRELGGCNQQITLLGPQWQNLVNGILSCSDDDY